jgi:hypothetical protein
MNAEMQITNSRDPSRVIHPFGRPAALKWLAMLMGKRSQTCQ